MLRINLQPRTQLGAGAVQFSIPLQVADRATALPGQQPAQMALAGTPVDPAFNRRRRARGGYRSKAGNLLPLAAGDVTVQQLGHRRGNGGLPTRQHAKLLRLCGQLAKWLQRPQKLGRLRLRRFGIGQRACAQPAGQFGPVGFPRKHRGCERSGSPQRLMALQPVRQAGEPREQIHAAGVSAAGDWHQP